MKTQICLYISLLLLFTVACKPGEIIEISAIPEIELLSVTPTQVQEFRDSIEFRIMYTDGDGDLGSNDSGAENLFIEDNRIQVIHSFRIQQLAPASVPIQGTFTAVLPNIIITDNSTQQTVNFDIWVTDRQGNTSNRITSPDITIIQ